MSPGLSIVAADLVGKWLELLKQVVPEVSQIAMLWKPDSVPDRTREVNLREADVSAQALGVQLQLSKREIRLTSTERSRRYPRRARWRSPRIADACV